PIGEPAGVVDELQAWSLARAERDGWVYTSALRQLINRMYRERDYLAQRKRDGRRTAYDYAVDRDQVALAWAIRALVRLMPTEEKAKPEPPKPPRTPNVGSAPRRKPGIGGCRAGTASRSVAGRGSSCLQVPRRQVRDHGGSQVRGPPH